MLTECNRNSSDIKKSKYANFFKFIDDSSRSCYAYGWYDSTGSNCFLLGDSWSSVFENSIFGFIGGLASLTLDGVSGGLATAIKIGKVVYDFAKMLIDGAR